MPRKNRLSYSVSDAWQLPHETLQKFKVVHNKLIRLRGYNAGKEAGTVRDGIRYVVIDNKTYRANDVIAAWKWVFINKNAPCAIIKE